MFQDDTLYILTYLLKGGQLIHIDKAPAETEATCPQSWSPRVKVSAVCLHTDQYNCITPQSVEMWTRLRQKPRMSQLICV